MGAADDRIVELLDRWLASVELHARYLSLDDAAYAKVEDWPHHQRPTRWLVDIARARCEELKRLLAERRAHGDETFADALELMAFLTNLMGSGHVERFIPVATGRAPRARPAAGPAPAPAVPSKSAPATPSTVVPNARGSPNTIATVGVARPPEAARPPTRGRSAPDATSGQLRPGGTGRQLKPQAPAPPRPAEETAPTAKSSAPLKGTATAEPAPPGSDPRVATVISDAVRMLSWGREWPQLAGLIARLAGRPDEKEVWAILRQHRVAIEARAARLAE
jgi:hypothetical protein